jgi:hypothetical protein
MATPNTKGDSSAEALEGVRDLQQILQQTDSRLQKVEEASRFFGVTQKQMDEKLDSIYKLLIQWNSGTEVGSA